MSDRRPAPSPAALPAVDVGRLVADLHSTFNPLAREFALKVHVTPAPDGFVCLSVALPEGMTRVFVSLLESLTGFVRYADNKARAASAEIKLLDLDQIAGREQAQQDFRRLVCRMFDGFTAQGLDRKEALKRTCAALKADEHPWAGHDLISRELRAAGRLRKDASRPGPGGSQDREKAGRRPSTGE